MRAVAILFADDNLAPFAAHDETALPATLPVDLIAMRLSIRGEIDFPLEPFQLAHKVSKRREICCVYCP